MKKRMVSMVLTAAVMGSVLSGCGNKPAQQENAGGQGSGGGNSYTMFMRSTYVNWIKELKWYDAAEEATGIHVEYVEGPDDFNDVYAEVWALSV